MNKLTGFELYDDNKPRTEMKCLKCGHSQFKLYYNEIDMIVECEKCNNRTPLHRNIQIDLVLRTWKAMQKT